MNALSSALFPVTTGRLRFIDFLRAIAAQLIVWHHLAFYGPLSDIAYPLAPVLLDALHQHARMAVQVFLVIGGFVTAQHMETLGRASWRGFVQEIAHRYRRTGGPYLVTLVFAIAANALANHWMDHRSISAPPTLDQLFAHALYAQDILGYEALSAGIWYLSIDFQLFVLVLAVNLLVRRAVPRANARGYIQASCAVLALASLFWFNRDAGFDHWAVYFFGSYFLGMVLRWVLSNALGAAALWGYLALVLAAVAIDWRPRLLVAALTATVIALAARGRWLQQWPRSPSIAYLGRISFSLFLVHFPICLLINAWFSRVPLSPLQSWLAMFVAYGASLAVAVVFHHFVETPFQRAGSRRAPGGRVTMGMNSLLHAWPSRRYTAVNLEGRGNRAEDQTPQSPEIRLR
jgi:peptidoglycan/LPS O-acetylase OafA/YrhL